jgi:hypothetical protein
VKTDTLDVAYTYWWPSGGPFIGLCGDSYSMVFTGTITQINRPLKPYTVHNDTTIVLYIPQYGVVKIEDIKYKNQPKEGYNKSKGKTYNGEKYFMSDCFHDLKLKVRDKVLVFIYSYEGAYCIPNNSILKIDNFNDPIVLSIDKYIKNNQDPLVIKADTTIWKKYGFDYSLKQIIECRMSIKNQK